MNKNIFLEQHLYAIRIADIYNPDVKKRLQSVKTFKTIFPAIHTLYSKDIIRDNDPGLYKTKMIKKKHFEEDKYGGSPNGRQHNNPHNNNHHMQISHLNYNDTTPTTSSETNSSGSREENLDKTCYNKVEKVEEFQKSIFSPKERSRFGFIEENIKDDGVCIPNFVQNLIHKKVSRHNFTKHIKHIEDLLYTDETLKSEYDKKNPWAHFILDNKTQNDDLELINDFEYINNLVLNKCKIHR